MRPTPPRGFQDANDELLFASQVGKRPRARQRMFSRGLCQEGKKERKQVGTDIRQEKSLRDLARLRPEARRISTFQVICVIACALDPVRSEYTSKRRYPYRANTDFVSLIFGA